MGSNLGDRSLNLLRAINLLIDLECRIILQSSTYKTSPVDNFDQPYFFNKVILITTKLSPYNLLKNLKEIEQSMGRDIKNSHNLPRIIDIDILTFNDLAVNSSELVIPHPRASERKFVMKPWLEIAPEYEFPGHSMSIKMLYSACIRKNKHQKVEIVSN